MCSQPRNVRCTRLKLDCKSLEKCVGFARSDRIPLRQDSDVRVHLVRVRTQLPALAHCNDLRDATAPTRRVMFRSDAVSRQTIVS